MINDLMKKLGDAQKQMEETKQKLEQITVTGEAESGKITVTANGNKRIVNINIAQELLESADKELVEDLLVTAINRALQNADKVFEQEMGSIAKGMMPPGFGLF